MFSKLLNKIYNKSPVFLQNIAISTYGAWWKQRRFSGIFKEELQGFKERETLMPDEWKKYQTKKLQQILVYSIENVPYYTEAFASAGFSIHDFKKFELSNLHELPLLTKQIFRKYGTTKLLSKRLEKGSLFVPSSGSTGTPVQVLYSTNFHRRLSAGIEARVRHWAGLSINDSRAMIGGRYILPPKENKPPFYRYNTAEKQLYMSAYHISKENAHDYFKGLLSYDVKYMTGYAMSNYFLATFFKEQKLKPPVMKAVITSSEKLTSEMRNLFFEVYNCRTYDSYSGVEGCSLISECEKGKLHISSDIGIVEVLNAKDKQCISGEVGELVCTGLLNFDQPLIRYRTGDFVKLSDNQRCSCRRNMIIVDEITGRSEDIVIGADGRHLVRFDKIFLGFSNIIAGQVIQLTHVKYDVCVIVDKRLTQSEKNEIRLRMQKHAGNIEINIREVEELIRGPNGKFAAVISKIKNNF